MSDREGPKTTIRRSCLDCKYEHSERYQVQGDSGHDVSCTHPSLPQAKRIADTSWNTPDWCPFLVAPSAPQPCPACSAAVELAEEVATLQGWSSEARHEYQRAKHAEGCANQVRHGV